ncbi:hypothetical protein ZWY2020_014994 [Hordeum vulgare]|nr:hypothetical protein ZWY2020_014994 [Hordeum vulgare]
MATLAFDEEPRQFFSMADNSLHMIQHGGFFRTYVLLDGIGYIMITDAEKGSSSQSRWRENCKTHEFLEERMQRNMREIHSIQDVAGSCSTP